MLLDADIAYNDTLFLYEQLVCVIQDLLFILLDDNIIHKDTFMNRSSLLCKISFCCCLLLTEPPRKLYSFMNSSFVLWKISFWCCLRMTLAQGYFITSWTFLLCRSRLPFVVALYWHCPHTHVIPWGTVFLVVQDLLLILLDTDILHKNTLFFHELFFYAYQD